MFFDISIGFHIESQMNIFCFVADIWSKIKMFAVSENRGPRLYAHLYAAMFHQNIPYCHRLGPGEAGRPKVINQPTLAYSPNLIEFELIVKVYQRQRSPE
jgi:hypothetical protein